MKNYMTELSDFYNMTVEAYRNMDNGTKTKIELFALAGIAAVYLYYSLPR